MNSHQDQQGQVAASAGSSISSEEELRRAKAAIQQYEQRKAEVRQVLTDVLAVECASQDGSLIDILSEGYRGRTGKTVESAMVSDFLSEIADRLSLPKNPTTAPPKKKPSKRKKPRKPGPRPEVVVRPDGEELEASGGWAGTFRAIAQEIANDYPGQEDIWGSLPFVKPKHLLPDYVVANTEIVSGLWLNAHGGAEELQRSIHMMLEVFGYPPRQWRVRLDDGTVLEL